MKRIRERVQRDQYTVDPAAVAAAIVERLIEGRPSSQRLEDRKR